MQSVFRRAALAFLMFAALWVAACSDQPLAGPATLALDAARADAPSPSPNADSPPLIGDCNGDWKIDERDAQQMEGMNGPIDPRDQMRAYQACDLDANLRVDARDAEIVWTYLTEGKSEFPLGWLATCPDLAVIRTVHGNDGDFDRVGPFRYDAYVVNLGTMTFRWSDPTDFVPVIKFVDGTRARFHYMIRQYWPTFITTDTGTFVGTASFAASREPYMLREVSPTLPQQDYFDFEPLDLRAREGITRLLSPWSVELIVNPANRSDGNPSNDDCNLLNNALPGETPRRPPSSWYWSVYYPE